MLAQDLMGLGVPPLQAARTANGGTGPLTLTATGTVSTATSAAATGGAARIGAFQYFFTCTTAGDTGGAAVILPTVGTDQGALLADDYNINNQTGTATLFVWCSAGVTISVGGTNTSYAKIGPHTTMTCFPQSTTQWWGVKGA